MNRATTKEEEKLDLIFQESCSFSERIIIWLAKKQISKIAKIVISRSYERRQIDLFAEHEMYACVDRTLRESWEIKNPKGGNHQEKEAKKSKVN